MADAATPLPFREDTLLGVCQAIGDDLGFNADWLRVVLAASLLWNPLAVIAGYLVAGVAIALLRWLVPARQVDVPVPVRPAEPAIDHEPLPLAA